MLFVKFSVCRAESMALWTPDGFIEFEDISLLSFLGLIIASGTC